MVTAPWRRTLVCVSLCFPFVLFASGCKTSSGWRAPWSGWGWSGASSPSATALNISKPSTQAPASTNTPGQPSRSLAGGSGGAGSASGITTASATSPTGGVTAYPATAHADAHPGRAAGTWQHDTGAGEVAPAGGYQVGPYGMQQQNPSGYANAPRNTPAAGATAPSAGVAAEGGYGGTEGYRTADQQPPGSRGRSAATSGNFVPTDNPGAERPGSIYDEAAGAATATEPSIYGQAGETSPAEDVGGASGPYSGGENPAESAASRTYGPPNTVAPAARPSTAPPAASGSARAPLPQSLSTSGGYRPGSTNGSPSARNADFEEGQNAAAPQDNATGGPMYR